MNLMKYQQEREARLLKYKIEELKDITDSREIMQSSPKGFSKYMTYIILVLLTCCIVWSLLATKEVSVTASGVVNPKNDITKVSSSTQGIVTKAELEEGRKVKKGDILVEVNGQEYKLQRDLLEQSCKEKTLQLQNLNKLKKSVLGGKNLFNSANKDEKEYYDKYELYSQSLNYSNSGQTSQSNEKDQINRVLGQLNLLSKSIKEERDYVQENSSVYYEYKNFSIGMTSYRKIIKGYEEKIKNLEKQKNNLEKENLDELEKITSNINELRNSIDSTKVEMDKFKNTSLMNVQSQIAQNKSRLLQLNTVNNSNYTEQYISSLESSINALESTISDINMNLRMSEEKVKLTVIKAPCDGVLNLISPVKEGDFIQNGTPIVTILPENTEAFNVDIYIPNENFGEIKEGQQVSIELLSLPGREYGYIMSNLKNISVDAKVSEQKGVSYYCAKCPINVTSLENSKGNKTKIKSGMAAQVRIVNRRVSYFRYFLEKIQILD